MPADSRATRAGAKPMAVSNYSIKKYIKGALLITAAIILVYIGFRYVFGIVPPADFQATQTLLVVLIWFVVIASIIFAVKNFALGYLNIESIWTIKSLYGRLNEVEKRIPQTGFGAQSSFGPSMVQPATVQEAPPPPEEVRSKKKIAAVIAVVVIILVAALAAVFVLGSLGGPGAGGATAEQAFDNLINRMNAHDAEGVIDQTIFKFDPVNRSQYVGGVDQFLSMGSFSITVNWRNVINKNDIPQANRTQIESMVAEMEQNFGIDITDYCVISFNITVSTSQGTMYQEEMMPAFLVDGLWYVLLRMDGNGSGGQDPVTVMENFIDALNTGDDASAFNMTVLKFSGDIGAAYSGFLQNLPDGTISTTSINARYYSQLNQSEKDFRDTITNKIEQKFGVTVQDYCVIDFVGTITNGSGTNPMEMSTPCMKINDYWLLVVGMEPDPIAVQLSSANSAGNWTLTVNAIQNATSIGVSNVRVIVFDDLGVVRLNVTLNSMTPGDYYSGVRFADVSTASVLDVGDWFSLDDSIYLVGSRFILADTTSPTIYANLQI